MIEVLLTTLETEMSTTAVDQDQVLAEQTVDQDLAEQIAQIANKVCQSVGAPETTDGISSKVAYRYIQHLEDKEMFREKLIASDRCKWADYLILLTHSEGSPECFKRILGEFNVSLTKPLLEILGI